MDAVLGVSLTPSTAGLVLLEGAGADGATVEHWAIDIRDRAPVRAGEICDQVVAAIRRAEELAAERGRHVVSIGVTWSAGAGSEATTLLDTLAAAGFGGVVPVRLPHATEALARTVADAVGFGTTGVCVLEPDVVQAMTVGATGAVRTTVSRGIETVAGLSGWLATTFDEAVPRPEALVVVGAAVDVDTVLPKLEHALRVPVFAPTEPGLPLARGAALASVRRPRSAFTDDVPAGPPRDWFGAHMFPFAVLACGVLTFVVSLSLAIGQQLLPDPPPGEHRSDHPVTATSGASVSVSGPQVPSSLPPVPGAVTGVPPEIPVPEVQVPDGEVPGTETQAPEAQVAEESGPVEPAPVPELMPPAPVPQPDPVPQPENAVPQPEAVPPPPPENPPLPVEMPAPDLPPPPAPDAPADAPVVAPELPPVPAGPPP